MITITQNRVVNDTIKTLKKGRSIDAVLLVRVRDILSDPENHERLNKIEGLAAGVISGKAKNGRRLNDGELEVLKLLDPVQASLYVTERETRSVAKSTADRVAAHVARRSDIGDIPAVTDAGRREACRLNLALFGITYCGLLLKHAPSANMMPFIDNMQSAILLGGRVHVRWPRGKGKSTWIKIGILWATLYGHRRFAVAFAASGRNAKAILGDIWKALDRSDELLADFPEVCYPVRCIKGVVQRCSTQTYKGNATEICKSVDMLTLPKIPGSIAAGAMIICRGVEAGTRGLVDMDQRPDFLFFDDIQTKKSAGSKSKTDWLEEFISQDAMCMGGHDSSIAALQASTPIKANDLSERFADVDQHPEWITFTTPLIIRWPANTDLVDEFGKLYRKDLANRDLTLSLSRAFFLENETEITAGSELLDPLDGDAKTEINALHHALILYYYIGREGFMAEYQMQTRRTQEVFSLEPATLCRALSGYERCVIPDECRSAVGFCDVNADADSGLRWGVVAFGSGRVASVIAYGRYPEKGRLYPEKSTRTQISIAISQGIAAVARHIAALPVRKSSGRRVPLTALCFDSGWETKVVARTLKTLRAEFSFHLIMSKGFSFKQYKPYKASGEARDGVVGVPGDHFHLSESENGVFLAVHTDYWREEAQRSFLAPPLQPGSCSFYGTDTHLHYDFAEEVCNERLADKGTGQNGTEFWIWTKCGPNHDGDVLSGCYVVAAQYRLYDATETIVERETATGNAAANPRRSAPAASLRAASAPNRFKARYALARR